MKRFTLMELLVVVAIIGILLSLLLPSLTKARHVSIQAVCMSNQNQLSKATLLYTKNNNSWLMPVNGSSAYEATQPIDSFFMHWQKRNNLGYIYRDDYTIAYEAFYCPAIPGNPLDIRPAASSDPQPGIKDIFTYQYYIEKFGEYPTAEEMPTMASNFDGRVRSSYYFNPEGKVKARKRIVDHDSSSIMTIDLMMNMFISHGQVGNNWVASKGDSSVKVIKSKEIRDIMFASEVHFNWSNYNSMFSKMLEASNN